MKAKLALQQLIACMSIVLKELIKLKSQDTGRPIPKAPPPPPSEK